MVAEWALPASQSLKDQGKSRTLEQAEKQVNLRSRNPLKIRASLERIHGAHKGKARSQSLKDQGKSRTKFTPKKGVLSKSQSLKDQGKSRTLDSLAFARRQSFSLRKH